MPASDYTDDMRIICTVGIYKQRDYEGAIEDLGLSYEDDYEEVSEWVDAMFAGHSLRYSGTESGDQYPINYGVCEYTDPEGEQRYGVSLFESEGLLYADFPTRAGAVAFYEFDVRATASALAGDTDEDGDPVIPFPLCDIDDISDGVPAGYTPWAVPVPA